MKKNLITIYRPRWWTKQLHESKKRWIVVVAHRRSGKTTATLNHLIRDALRTPASKYAFICPTYKQAKNVAWDILKDACKLIEGVSFNESELRVDFKNKSRITLYGADNPDSLRGIALWGVVFDEYSQQPSNIFTEIIRPALADHKGYAIWIGTPKGKNEFYHLYEKAKLNDRWDSIMLKASESRLIDAQELEEAMAAMSEEEYEQEFECSFLAGLKGSYYSEQISQARKENRITRVPHDKTVPVTTYWDIGLSDATAILFVQRIGKEWRFIDYYENTEETLDHYVKVLQDKGYIYANHWWPWDTRARDMATGMSLIDKAKQLGLQAQVTPNISVNEGIGIARMKFSQVWIDEGLERFVDTLSQYRKEWDDKRGEFKNKPLHDWTSHCADSVRYWAVVSDREAMQLLRKEQRGEDGYRSVLPRVRRASRARKKLTW